MIRVALVIVNSQTDVERGFSKALDMFVTNLFSTVSKKVVKDQMLANNITPAEVNVNIEMNFLFPRGIFFHITKHTS